MLLRYFWTSACWCLGAMNCQEKPPPAHSHAPTQNDHGQALSFDPADPHGLKHSHQALGRLINRDKARAAARTENGESASEGLLGLSPLPDQAMGLLPSPRSHSVPPTEIMYGEGDGKIGNMYLQPTCRRFLRCQSAVKKSTVDDLSQKL